MPEYIDNPRIDPQADACSQAGALRLIDTMATYWKRRGYQQFQGRTEPVIVPRFDHNNEQLAAYYRHRAMRFYAVRSNLGPGGYPPG